MKHLIKLLVISALLLFVTITSGAQTPAKSYLKKECKGCDKTDVTTQASSDAPTADKKVKAPLTTVEKRELHIQNKNTNKPISVKNIPNHNTTPDKKLAKATKKEYKQAKPLTKEEKLAEIKKLEWQISQLDASNIPEKANKLEKLNKLLVRKKSLL